MLTVLTACTRFMKQLGSSVDDAFGEDEKPAGGGRRGSKEKKCTPLKEKLHKMWGGRVRAGDTWPLQREAPCMHCFPVSSGFLLHVPPPYRPICMLQGYMERLDVVMAEEAGQQGAPSCEDQPAEEVFKPMFLSHPTAAEEPAEAEGQADEAIPPPRAHPQPKASPSRRHPPAAASSSRAAAAEGSAPKTSKQQPRPAPAAAASGKAPKASSRPAAVTAAPAAVSSKAEVASEKPGSKPPSRAKAVGVQPRPATGIAASTPASSSRLLGKGFPPAAGASPMEIDDEGPAASTAERTVKASSALLPVGAVVWDRKRAEEEGQLPGKRAAVSLPMAVLPCPAPRSTSLAGKPVKKAPATVNGTGRVGGADTPASSLPGQGAAQTSPSPQATKRPREAAMAGGSGGSAQYSAEESRAKVAKLQQQCDGRAAEIAVLKGEKKELEVSALMCGTAITAISVMLGPDCEL